MEDDSKELWGAIDRLDKIMKTLQTHFEQQSFLIGNLTARVNSLEARKKK